jgi:hypothetical protein
LLRFFAELPVKLRVIVRVHPTLKHLRGGRSIKELSRDAQCTDPVTGSPCILDLVGFANAFHQHGAPRICEPADDLTWLDEELDGRIFPEYSAVRTYGDKRLPDERSLSEGNRTSPAGGP